MTEASEAPLTEKQEAFVRAYFETGNAAEAYRQAYDVSENARDNWIYVEACQLLDRPKVALRLKVLRDQADRLSIYTRETAIKELEQARLAAMTADTPQVGAAVSAITAKAKLLGLDKPMKHELTGLNGGSIPVEVKSDRELAKAVAALLTGATSADG
jgi:phage terminase small subunit